MTREIIHALTPGDHFSPRTGSAIPTVAHGLATAARHDPSMARIQHRVLVDAATYHPRYDSAAAIEYAAAPSPAFSARVADALGARLGLPRRGAVRAYAPMVARLADESPCIVLAHNAPVLPQMLASSPHEVVLYAHNDILRSVGPSEARRALASVAAIVCVSADLADVTASRLPRELAARVHVVDNGVDTAQFSPPVVPRAGGGRLRILFVGRTISDKGPDVLLRALRHVRGDVEVQIVGSYGFSRDAPLSAFERSLRDLAAAESAPVTFEPFVERRRLPDLLRAADVFVAPSRWREPSGLTIGEAMATGLPVIASDVGGIPEVLGDAGVLIPPDDPMRLADAITHMVQDHAARHEYGLRARTRALGRDWRHSWRQLRDVVDAI